MKKKRVQMLMGVLITAAFLFAGCGKPKSDRPQEEGAQAGRIPIMDENTILGEVEEIGENTITVALAQMPERPQGEEPPDGEEPPEDMPEGTEWEEPPEGMFGEDGEAPKEPPEEGQMEFTLTGETQEISVTESTTYEVDGEEGSLKDLSVDDLITVSLAEDGSAKAVRVGMGQPGESHPEEDGAQDESGSEGETETQAS